MSLYFGLLVAVGTACGAELVTCATTAGREPLVFELRRDWAPHGAARFVELVKVGFFDGSALFRVVPGFLVQLGIAADPAVNAAWRAKGQIVDDERARMPAGPFRRGYLSFAGAGPNSRTTQLFVAYKDSTHLGKAPWETPIGFARNPDVADRFYGGYGDGPPFNPDGVDQGALSVKGAEWARAKYPKLDFITRCVHAPDPDGATEPPRATSAPTTLLRRVDELKVNNDAGNNADADDGGVGIDNAALYAVPVLIVLVLLCLLGGQRSSPSNKSIVSDKRTV